MGIGRGVAHAGSVGDNRAMHPNALLELCAELVDSLLLFDKPADALVSDFFRANKALGQRERHTVAETAYTVLRKREAISDAPLSLARMPAVTTPLASVAPRTRPPEIPAPAMASDPMRNVQ